MGAIIAGVVVAGAAAYGAHEANKNSDKQAGATNDYNQSVLDTWTQIQKENSGIYKQIAMAIPDMTKLNIGPATKGFSEYNQQRPYVQNVANTARTIDKAANKNFQSSLSETSPDLLPAISKLTSQARSFLNGDLPKDVSDLVVRKAAERAASGGYGIDSGMGRNLVSRDLGLTSLDMIGRGASMLPGALAATTAVNPFQTNVQSLFFTPEYLQGRQDAATGANWNVENENKNRAFQRISGVLSSKLKSMPPLYREAIPEHQSEVAAGVKGFAAGYTGMGAMGGAGGGSSTAPAPTGVGGVGGVGSAMAGASGSGAGMDWSKIFNSIMGGLSNTPKYNG